MACFRCGWLCLLHTWWYRWRLLAWRNGLTYLPLQLFLFLLQFIFCRALAIIQTTFSIQFKSRHSEAPSFRLLGWVRSRRGEKRINFFLGLRIGRTFLFFKIIKLLHYLHCFTKIIFFRLCFLFLLLCFCHFWWLCCISKRKEICGRRVNIFLFWQLGFIYELLYFLIFVHYFFCLLF